MSPERIDDAHFASHEVLQRWCDRIGGEGFRGTGTAAHERIISWVEDELAQLPGLTVRTEEYEVLRWQPVPEGDLEHAGTLVVDALDIAIAGAVPYSLPSARQGPLVHLAKGEAITPENAAGK